MLTRRQRQRRFAFSLPQHRQWEVMLPLRWRWKFVGFFGGIKNLHSTLLPMERSCDLRFTRFVCLLSHLREVHLIRGFDTYFLQCDVLGGHLRSPQRRCEVNNFIKIKANLSWAFFYFHFNVSCMFNSLLTYHPHQRRRSSAARFEFIFLRCSRKTKSWK